jgi:hypothetical protein
MTFPVTGAEPYIDEDFKAMTDECHLGLTPLYVSLVDLLKSFMFGCMNHACS